MRGRDRSSWRAYVGPRGKRYYYNSLLNVSSWDRPAELCTDSDVSSSTDLDSDLSGDATELSCEGGGRAAPGPPPPPPPPPPPAADAAAAPAADADAAASDSGSGKATTGAAGTAGAAKTAGTAAAAPIPAARSPVAAPIPPAGAAPTSSASHAAVHSSDCETGVATVAYSATTSSQLSLSGSPSANEEEAAAAAAAEAAAGDSPSLPKPLAGAVPAVPVHPAALARLVQLLPVSAEDGHAVLTHTG